jgi:hypothetical protein
VYRPPERLPAKGRIEAIRFIRSNRRLDLFGKKIIRTVALRQGRAGQGSGCFLRSESQNPSGRSVSGILRVEAKPTRPLDNLTHSNPDPRGSHRWAHNASQRDSPWASEEIVQAQDTSPAILDQQVESWRAMSPSEKAACVDLLNRDVQRMAEVGIRQRYPMATDREVFLRLAALRNGRELSIAAYGWDPEAEGW